MNRMNENEARFMHIKSITTIFIINTDSFLTGILLKRVKYSRRDSSLAKCLRKLYNSEHKVFKCLHVFSIYVIPNLLTLKLPFNHVGPL